MIDQRGTSAEIEGDDGQSLIHRQHEVAGAIDAAAVAERFREKLAEYDAGVFDGVMLVDVEIAFGGEVQIECAVLGEQLEHVVEKPDSGRNVVCAAAFDFEGFLGCGFLLVLRSTDAFLIGRTRFR